MAAWPPAGRRGFGREGQGKAARHGRDYLAEPADQQGPPESAGGPIAS
jgi:hypothetical protein